jgi:hypothetical protein
MNCHQEVAVMKFLGPCTSPEGSRARLGSSVKNPDSYLLPSQLPDRAMKGQSRGAESKERNHLEFAEVNCVRYFNAGNGSWIPASNYKPIEK